MEAKCETYRSCEMLWNSSLFAGFVCILKLAVRTNWPTVALKPARKALKGYCSVSHVPARNFAMVPGKFSCDGKGGRGGGRERTKFPASTQHTNCNPPTTIRNAMNTSSNLTRCGVSFKYLSQTPSTMS